MRLISDGFVAQMQQQPDKTAVFINGGDRGTITRSYRELWIVAEQVAAIIRTIRFKQSDCSVGLLLPNGIEFLEIFLGAVIAGSTVMVLEPKWTPLQIQQVFRQKTPDLLFIDCSYLTKIPPHLLPKQTVLVTNLVTSFQQEQQTQTLVESQKFLTYDRWKAQLPLPCCPTPISEESAFYIGFTSGTTGQPKGVVRSHRSWLNSFAASRVEFGTCAADRILVPGSLTHSLSLYAALECLNAGATLYLLPQFSLKGVLDCLHHHSISLLVAVPTLLRTIAKTLLRQKHSISGLRAIIAGGSKLEADLRNELPQVFPSAEVLEYFGALELSFITLASSQEIVPPTSVGRAFKGVKLSIRRQDGTEAAVGEVGLIAVQSTLLSSGYLVDAPLVDAPLVDAPLGKTPLGKTIELQTGLRWLDGWATVGDMGWQDANGYLFVVGREQDMVVTGGVNVYPAEVEAVLSSFPEIEQVAVFGIPDCDRGQALCAAITWTASPLTRSQMQQRLCDQLPTTKHPRHYFKIEQFPTTPSGKIIRSALQELAISHNPALQPLL